MDYGGICSSVIVEIDRRVMKIVSFCEADRVNRFNYHACQLQSGTAVVQAKSVKDGNFCVNSVVVKTLI